MCFNDNVHTDFYFNNNDLFHVFFTEFLPKEWKNNEEHKIKILEIGGCEFFQSLGK